MTDHLLPTYTQIASTISYVTNNLNKARRFGGLRRNFTRGQIQRGEDYMDASHIIFQLCRPLLFKGDKLMVRNTFKRARDARTKLNASNVSGVQRFYGARKFKSLCKETFEVVKVTSRRLLADSLLRTLDETDPPAGAPPPTPEESDGRDPPAGASPAAPEEPDGIGLPAGAPPAPPEEPDGTDPPAGAPPATPEEPDRPPPHDPCTDSYAAVTSSIDKWVQDTKMTTLSSGAAGSGGPMDKVPETNSFIYDPDLASSGTSIASYKTERTVNSRKSRYNTPPRRKYAESHLSVPQGLMSNVDDASVPKTELRDESLSSPLNAQPISPKPEFDLESRPGPSSGTQPLDGSRAALPASATEHVHWNTRTQPPSPHQGEFLTARPPPRHFPDHWTTGGAKDVDDLSEVSSGIFGSDSEAGADD